MIAKTGNAGRNIGQVDLEFSGPRLTGMQGRLIPVANVAANAEVARVVDRFESEIIEKTRLVVGDARSEFAAVRDAESPLANLTADAFREKTKTQIALHNLGGIRARIGRGPVTWGDVFEVLPFQNTLVTMKLTGLQLKQILARNLLAVSGIRVRMDLGKPPGQKLVAVQLSNGTPIENATLYSVTTNDFLVAGGDGFTEFAQAADIQDSGILLRDALLEFIQDRRSLSPVLDGRVAVD
jgi:2',3'-cyclic-nucleotide 2'-phosphodiesterase/3'-nucleotidase